MADPELCLASAGGKFRVEPDQPSKRKIRALAPPVSNEGPPPDLGEGFPAEARSAIEAGEHALVDLRENTVHRWYLVGGACFMLRNVALNRSGANNPTGRRYNRTYATLAYMWPQLAKLDKSVRSHAIWLFENYDIVKAWLATLPQNQRDRWTHPLTIRNHFEKRRPYSMRGKPMAFKPRPTRHRREWKKQSLRDRTREDLEAMIASLLDDLSDRDRENIELREEVEAQSREITQLREDLAWEKTSNRQLERLVTPPAATTAVRPDGEVTEVVHAIARASQEIVPPLKHGQLDYAAWAKKVLARSAELSALELQHLLSDNRESFDDFERRFPGAGIGLEDRIRARIDELDLRYRAP